MRLRTSFQTLPIQIVHQVLEYLEGYPREYFGPTTEKYYERKAVLAPLLLVGEHWCTAALASICETCELRFIHKRKAIEVTFPAWPASAPYIQYRKTPLVRRVIVSASLWEDLCDGSFCETISMSQYESLMFPSARTLLLYLSKATEGALRNSTRRYSSQLPASAICDWKVAGTAGSLLRLVPATRNVRVQICSISDTVPDYLQFYNRLIMELCRGSVSSLNIHSWLDGSTLPLSLGGISGLTSLTQGLNIPCPTFTRLAFLNAGTLRTLDIGLTSEDDWFELIYGGREHPTVYNNLSSLTLETGDTAYGANWEAIEDAEPFPVLSTLKVSGGYPFDDDLLFRGNGETLQNLHVPFSAIARGILGRFDVFKRSGVTLMNRICTDAVTAADKEFIAANADTLIEIQVHGILKVSSSLVIMGDTDECHIYLAIYTAPTMSFLQHLEFATLVLDASHIFQVIAALPNLVSLACKISGCGPDIEAVPESERPRDLFAKYYPLSYKFRSLNMADVAGATAEDIAHLAMLLAVVCPSFRAANVLPALRREFSREVAWSMLNAAYQPYADSLRSLIYLG
ncbi:hypothetical protein GGI17_003025 [Coemansia sp. S146]|nr:hypothetical protein GGI17_003025 [Coemansia sp. S146]